MAKKPTIRSSLFQPTVPVANEPIQPAAPLTPPVVEEPKHHTSTRIPLEIHRYFEELAVEYGYSTHSLRIYALAWFAKEHKRGNIRLERDRSVTGKRVLAMPDID
jgi:hypothetical protein